MAANVIMVALAGYNALTDTDPNHFSLYADQLVDYILIKEKARGSANVASGGTVNVAHGLNYVPMCFAFVEESAGVWRKLFSSPIDGSGFWFEINDTNLVLRNTSGSLKSFVYQIFYDNIT